MTMSTYTTADCKRTARVGPSHCYLGTDIEGRLHHWDRTTNTVHVVADGDRVHREDLDRLAEIEDWVGFVAWDELRYGVGLAGALSP